MSRPQRPRSHQLEAESRTALRSALPSGWVFRDQDQDYGLDGEIEIFDEADFATGAKYWVQLKATDKRLDKALRMSLTKSTGSYYASLDLPVLIVLYHAPTKQLYTRWFHSIDPYYGKPGANSVSFTISTDRRWTAATANQLAAELEAYRQLRSRRLERPLRFTVFVEGEEIHGVPRFTLLSQLREAAASTRGLLEFRDGAYEQQWTPHRVDLTPRQLEITLAGAHGFTLHSPDGYLPDTTPTHTLFRDVLVGIGLTLEYHDHETEGADLVAKFAAESRFSREATAALTVGRCLARANRLTAALEIAELFFRDERSARAAQMLVLSVLANSEKLTAHEREFAQQVLTRMAAQFAAAGDGSEAAVHYYNAAQIPRSDGRYREAIYLYHQAGKCLPRYWERGYFCAELAGMLFLSRRYRCAAHLYRRAVGYEDSARARYNLADSLLFSGAYAEAMREFELAVSAPGPMPSYPYEQELKAFSIGAIISAAGSESQQRKSRAAETLLAGELLGSPQELAETCEQALRYDALCATAWYNLGTAKCQLEDRAGAFPCFLLYSLLTATDVDAWIGTAVLAVDANLEELTPMILATAYLHNGESVLRSLAAHSNEHPELYRNLDELSSQLREVVKSKQEFTVREHFADGAFGAHTIHK